MNEATLEARLHKVLDQVFPTHKNFEIVHQGRFSVQFGHKEIQLDTDIKEKTSSIGIYDVLLKIDGRNIILFELKRLGMPLQEKDHLQALSYARLIPDFPPLTVVTNGTESRVIETFSSQLLDKKVIDYQLITELIESATSIAADKMGDAIKFLLNRNYSHLAEVVNEKTKEAFDKQTGSIEEYWLPISKDFLIKRKVVSQIQEEFKAGNNLLGVIAPPIGGKTNLLYQVYAENKEQDYLILYIDCNEIQYSIFRFLANVVSNVCKVATTEDEAREWVFNELARQEESSLTLLLDNYSKNTPKIIQSNVKELLDFGNPRNLRILYTSDEYNFKKLTKVPNRINQNSFGRESTCFYLKHLSREEFEEVNELILSKFGIQFQQGSVHNKEFRTPRIIKQVIAIRQHKIKGKDLIFTTPSITDFNFCKSLADFKIYPKSLHDYNKMIASCVLNDRLNKQKDARFNSYIFSNGGFDSQTFKKKFKKEYKSLVKSGFVSEKQIPNYKTILYPQFPELLSLHLIEEVYNYLFTADKVRSRTIEKTLEEFFNILNLLPYSDIVGDGVLKKLSQQIDTKSFLQVLDKLLEDKPYHSSLSSGTVFGIPIDGKMHTFKLEGNVEEAGQLLLNETSYTILSHFALQGFSISKDEIKHDLSYYKKVLQIVASTPMILHKPSFYDFREIEQLRTLEIESKGSVVDTSEGIVEPITQALQNCFRQFPNIVVELVDEAIKEKNIFLCIRIYTAIYQFGVSSSESLRKYHKKLIKKCVHFLDSEFNLILED